MRKYLISFVSCVFVMCSVCVQAAENERGNLPARMEASTVAENYLAMTAIARFQLRNDVRQLPITEQKAYHAKLKMMLDTLPENIMSMLTEEKYAMDKKHGTSESY